MSCRVGMTTDVVARKKYWQSQHSNFRNWKILGTYRSKAEAQESEKEFAKQYSCKAHHGGSGNEFATWHVYKFNY